MSARLSRSIDSVNFVFSKKTITFATKYKTQARWGISTSAKSSPRAPPKGKHLLRIFEVNIRDQWWPLFYISKAVIQYWTFSWVLRLTPTVILTVPIPTHSYFIMIIFSNGFWLLFFFALTVDTRLALVNIASSCNTASVDRYVRAACAQVSVIETKRILMYSFRERLYLLIEGFSIFHWW